MSASNTLRPKCPVGLICSSPPSAMHRAALRVPLRHAIAPRRRTFVSTVLLTKAWENESINELKKEARKRGLSAAGNKATLVTRLKQDDQKKAFAPEPTPHPQVRRASTSAAPSTSTESATEVPGIPSTAEVTHPKHNLDIQIPDVSEPEPEVLVQIPFVPDLWESSKLKHTAVPAEAAPSDGPKVVVIGGEGTHPGGGPSHNLWTASPPSQTPRKEPSSHVGKLLADMADDLDIPTTLGLPGPGSVHYDAAAKTETSGSQDKSYSRTLDGDEKKGLWVLFGVFAGSWVAGSFLSPLSEWAHKAEQTAQDVEEKAAGKNH
ncbi:hypothetical protein C8Q80DRAFT_1170500 [Daedaleopsis nitida]|nr:hypothetical protein C8Q80DRAFT_1170500 [Daedaleopsis nitida]